MVLFGEATEDAGEASPLTWMDGGGEFDVLWDVR